MTHKDQPHGHTSMLGMHHPQQIARLVEPARRERPAHLYQRREVLTRRGFPF